MRLTGAIISRPSPASRREISRRRRPGAGTSGEALKILTRLALVLGAVGVLLAGGVLSAYGYTRSSGIILPGVRVDSLSLEGLSVQAATNLINRTWNLDRQLAVVDGADVSRSWVARPADFGLSVDARKTAERAFGVGHGPDPVQDVEQAVEGLQNGVVVRPLFVLDPLRAQAGLETWALQVNIPAVEAELRIEDGQVIAKAGRDGRQIDTAATMAFLAENPGTVMEYGILPVSMKPVYPQIADVSAAAARAERLLAGPTPMTAYDPVTGETSLWTPARDMVAGWIRIERNASEFSVSIDGAGVGAFVTGLMSGLGSDRFFEVQQAVEGYLTALETGQPSGPLIIRYLPRSHYVRASDTETSIGWQYRIPFWQIAEVNPQVKWRGLVPGETIVIPPKDALLDLPVVANKRIVISIQEQRLRTYESGALRSEHVVSTGIDRSPTLPGIFQVQSHELSAYASRWDLTMPHFLGIYEAVPHFWNGIHGLPTLSNGVTLWANVLGRPASYGCIILSLDEAEELYNWAEDGVVVEIQG